MHFDSHQLAHLIENHTEPEPFSGIVYLTQGDEVLFEKGHGLACRSQSIPNTSDTRFQMASGSKIFTSVAVCQLVEQGELTFNTPLSQCVDVVLPHYWQDITVHQLLTHSSGITSYFEEDINSDYEAVWQNLPMYKMRRPRDFLPLFQHKPVKFSPGERFDYNDGGYILLGLVIECVTGMEFSEYIHKRVLKPAGMKDSGYFVTDQLPDRVAYAYIKNDDETWRTNFFAVPIIGAPDGGAYVTAPDMALFWKALTGNRLLNAKTTETLFEAQIVTSKQPPSTHYGYGVWIERSKEAVRKYYVEGFDPGVALRSAFYRDKDLVLTVIGNTAHALWPLYRKLEKLLSL